MCYKDGGDGRKRLPSPRSYSEGADKPEGASAIYHSMLRINQCRGEKNQNIYERTRPTTLQELLDLTMPEVKTLSPLIYVTQSISIVH